MTTKTAEKTETVYLLPLSQLHKSPSQPRRRGYKKPDDDFVASIVSQGVVSPIVTRVRKAGGWEIVYGHRRFDGSVMAKLDTIPAIVRDLTDDQVFELQLIENVHREDMHPLDEADGFRRLVDKHKRTPQQIADQVGRPLAYVVQRLKLVDLDKEIRARLEKDTLSLGVAMLLARVPAALQAEALRQLWSDVDVAQARRLLTERFMLRLDQAPFDTTDAALVPAAGACNVCPKRTGQQRELFADVGKADMCVDPVCYRGKLDAVWEIRKREAAAGGVKVVEGKAAERAMGYGSGYRKLDDDEWVGSARKKVRSLFSKKDMPPITLAREARSGAIVELVSRADVDKVLKRRSSPAQDSYSAQQRKQQAKDKLRAAAIGTAIGAAIDAMAKLGTPGLVRLLTRALVARTWDDSEKKIMSRRGVDRAKGKGTRSVLEEYLRTLTKPADVAGLGMELALWTFAPSRWGSKEREWDDTLRAVGVNFAAIEKKLAADAKAKKKGKKK